MTNFTKLSKISNLIFPIFSLQREINEVLEQRKSNDTAVEPQSLHDQRNVIRNEATLASRMNPSGRVQSQNGLDFMQCGNLRDAHCKLNEKIIRNANSLNASSSIDTSNHGRNIRKTNEWADLILKDLDNLILSNQRYAAGLHNSSTGANDGNGTAIGSPKSPHKRSTIINVVLRKTTPSPTSPTAPTSFAAATTTTNQHKNHTGAASAANAKDNNKIPKPEKHVSVNIASLCLSAFPFYARSLAVISLRVYYLPVPAFMFISSFVFRHLWRKSL